MVEQHMFVAFLTFYRYSLMLICLKKKPEAHGKRDSYVFSTFHCRKRKATKPIKIKVKAHASECGRYYNSVLNKYFM